MDGGLEDVLDAFVMSERRLRSTESRVLSLARMAVLRSVRSLSRSGGAWGGVVE